MSPETFFDHNTGKTYSFDGGQWVERLALKEVIILKDTEMESDALEALAKETGCLVIILPEGGSLASLDEENMRRAGWVRA